MRTAGRGAAVTPASLGPVRIGAGVGVLALAAVAVGIRVGVGSPSAVEVATAAARLAVDGLGAVELGLALLPFLLGGTGGVGGGAGAAERARRSAFGAAARLGALVGAGWAIASVLALWLRAADAAGRTPMTVPAGALLDYAGRIAAGRGLLLTLACALAATALALAWGVALARRAPARYPELAVGVTALGLLPGPVTGHAAGHGTREPSVLAIALHVTAASVWVGGLLAVLVVLAGRRRLLADALPRFSSVAGCCAGVVAVSGVLSAVFRLPSPAALVGGGYGALLLAKATGMAGLLGLGWRARRRVAAGGASPPVVRWLGVELAVMAVVFGLGPALASTAPA